MIYIHWLIHEDLVTTKRDTKLPRHLVPWFTNSRLTNSQTVDLVIWLLFRRHHSAHKPPHLLCHGFQRASARGQNGLMLSAAPAIPGIVSHYPNANVDTVKGPLWSRIHSMLGPGGDRIMQDLLLDCGIFCSVEGQIGNYYQLSGTSIIKPCHCDIS